MGDRAVETETIETKNLGTVEYEDKSAIEEIVLIVRKKTDKLTVQFKPHFGARPYIKEGILEEAKMILDSVDGYISIHENLEAIKNAFTKITPYHSLKIVSSKI